MREAALQSQVMRYLRLRGAYPVKVHGTSRGVVGTPDIIACYRGRFIAIELKSTGGRPTPAQRYQIERIQAAGGIAIITRSVLAVQELLNEIDAEVGPGDGAD